MRIEKLRENYNIDIKLIHFPLHPDTPAEGREMAGFYAQRGLDPDKMYSDMKERMDAEGLPYGKRTHSYNSRLSQELGKWADTIEGGEKLHEALYKAYFVESKNIGDVDVLLEAVASVGLSVDDARKVLEERTFEAEIDA
ncbi:MAG: putative DsbA family dithiol-disulfide isomerase, partial [Alphaproteobacteria bacterium]